MAHGLRARSSAGIYRGTVLSPPSEKASVIANSVGDKVEQPNATTEPSGGRVEATHLWQQVFDTKLKSFCEGGVMEARPRNAAGRTSASRIRSESPGSRLNDPLWTHAAYWNQRLAAPAARPPEVVEPGKLSDSSETSLHVEARKQRLEDHPADARSLYPLTGPLMRRSYLMDDLATPADQPVQRNADADNSPWCRRTTCLDDATYRHLAYRSAVGDPLYRDYSDYYGARRLTDPLYRDDLYGPSCRGALIDPLYQCALADPLCRDSLADPFYRRRVDPLYRDALVDPLYRRSAFRSLSPRSRRLL